MSKVVLPQAKVAPVSVSPRRLLVYGVAKVGKTTALAQLEDNLIIDLEKGTDMIAALKLNAYSVADIEAILNEIRVVGTERYAKGQRAYPYRYITLDTADALEEMCDVSALAKFKNGKLASKEQKESLTSITELPHGLGYYYLREEVKRVINLVGTYCERIILTAHVKDRIVAEKAGAVATVKDISLSGKLSSIICANMDAIGYMYRTPGSTTPFISFESFDANQIMGARCEHLAGKKMELDWSKIFID